MMSGDEWYVLEASRAVNQAIGRVIRHQNDYGAILLCDSRFNNPRQKNQLSKWIQGHLTNASQHSSFGPIIAEVTRFFRNAEKTLPQPALRSIDAISSNSPTKTFNFTNSSYEAGSSVGSIIPKQSVMGVKM